MDDRRPGLLAFSTLACPEWDADTVLEQAVAFGYDGIEWRGGPAGTVRPTWSQRQRRLLRQALEHRGIRSVAVTAYTNLISSHQVARQESARQLVKHLELARDLDATCVRVFVGIPEDDASEVVLMDRAIASLAAALPRARALGVGMAIEPHDDHVLSRTIRPILEALPDPAIGVAWDFANAWSQGEAPGIGLSAYAGRILYVQVKDGTGTGPAWRLCPIGDGDVPIGAALNGLWALTAGSSLPPISVEWERAWHPELAPADAALPAALAWLQGWRTGPRDLPRASQGGER